MRFAWRVSFRDKLEGIIDTIAVTFGGTVSSYRYHMELVQYYFRGTFNTQFGGKKWVG